MGDAFPLKQLPAELRTSIYSLIHDNYTSATIGGKNGLIDLFSRNVATLKSMSKTCQEMREEALPQLRRWVYTSRKDFVEQSVDTILASWRGAETLILEDAALFRWGTHTEDDDRIEDQQVAEKASLIMAEIWEHPMDWAPLTRLRSLIIVPQGQRAFDPEPEKMFDGLDPNLLSFREGSCMVCAITRELRSPRLETLTTWSKHGIFNLGRRPALDAGVADSFRQYNDHVGSFWSHANTLKGFLPLIAATNVIDSRDGHTGLPRLEDAAGFGPMTNDTSMPELVTRFTEYLKAQYIRAPSEPSEQDEMADLETMTLEAVAEEYRFSIDIGPMINSWLTHQFRLKSGVAGSNPSAVYENPDSGSSDELADYIRLSGLELEEQVWPAARKGFGHILHDRSRPNQTDDGENQEETVMSAGIIALGGQ